MTGFIIVVVCVTGSIIWGIAGGRKRRKEQQQEADKKTND